MMYPSPSKQEVAHDAAVESEMILRRRPFRDDILSNLFTRRIYQVCTYDMMLYVQGINDTIRVVGSLIILVHIIYTYRVVRSAIGAVG